MYHVTISIVSQDPYTQGSFFVMILVSIKFSPMYQSESFGRTFWIDGNDNFKSAPTLVSGGADYEMRDYVSDWTDWEGVNVDLLLTIYRQLLTTKIDKFYQDRL